MYRSDRSISLRRVTEGPGVPWGLLLPRVPSADALPEGWPATLLPESDSRSPRDGDWREGAPHARRRDDLIPAASVRPLKIRGVSGT